MMGMGCRMGNGMNAKRRKIKLEGKMKWSMDKYIPDQQPTAAQPEDPISASAREMKWGDRRGGRLGTRGSTK
jgi:hypothetical protein